MKIDKNTPDESLIWEPLNLDWTPLKDWEPLDLDWEPLQDWEPLKDWNEKAK